MEIRDEVRFLLTESCLRATLTEIHVRAESYITYHFQCMRCRHTLVGTLPTIRGLRLTSRGVWEWDISQMASTSFRDIVMTHNHRCWDHGMESFTTDFTDYTSVTSIPMGNQQLAQFEDLRYRGEPIRIEVDEYGEQHIVRNPISRNLRNALADAVKEATKPFSKEERRRKHRKKLVEVNCRLIRED